MSQQTTPGVATSRVIISEVRIDIKWIFHDLSVISLSNYDQGVQEKANKKNFDSLMPPVRI